MANWLHFEKMKEWDSAVLPFFQYDAISDDLITQALQNQAVLQHVNPTLDWEDDHWLTACATVSDEHKHAYRVAALVQAFRNGQPMHSSIHLDTFNLGCCGCGVSNGHHRIRALQYLGVPCGPFGLSGYLDPLEDLVRLAGMELPSEFSSYFDEHLLQTSEDDVTCD